MAERWEYERDRDRDYRHAGETALGRPDWGDREGSYEDRDRFWRERSSGLGRTEPHNRTVYTGPVYWRDELTHVNYAGMGPRGYRRSDQRMLEDVCDRLTDDPRVNASDIEVKCHEGVVTLTGSVTSREEKRHAEDVVESVTGIQDVQNNLRVQSGHIGSPGTPQALGLTK
ncbi:MAG: BON domain-containing protein [Vicinamibacterales bacterium]